MHTPTLPPPALPPSLKGWWLLSEALLGLIFPSLRQAHCKEHGLLHLKTYPVLCSPSSLTFRKHEFSNVTRLFRVWEPSSYGTSGIGLYCGFEVPSCVHPHIRFLKCICRLVGKLAMGFILWASQWSSVLGPERRAHVSTAFSHDSFAMGSLIQNSNAKYTVSKNALKELHMRVMSPQGWGVRGGQERFPLWDLGMTPGSSAHAFPTPLAAFVLSLPLQILDISFIWPVFFQPLHMAAEVWVLELVYMKLAGPWEYRTYRWWRTEIFNKPVGCTCNHLFSLIEKIMGLVMVDLYLSVCSFVQ